MRTAVILYSAIIDFLTSLNHWGLHWWQSGKEFTTVVKNLPVSAGGTDLIPVLGRSPGEGNGNLLQYSCQGNPMDRERSLEGNNPWVAKELDMI